MSENTRVRRVVLLGRVSRGERQQDPESQLAPLRAAVTRQGWVVPPGCEIALKLSAWDASAATEVRRHALAPIEEGRADVLAVWALDRICRGGTEDAFAFLRHLERHLGADFYSLQEPFLSTAADPQSRELLLGILAWAARWESQRKSERLRAKVQTKRAAAEKLGQRARWGRGVSATASEVGRVHELRAAGGTVRSIGAELGLSKSQVSTILRVRPVADGQDAGQTGSSAPADGLGLGQAPGPGQATAAAAGAPSSAGTRA